jgi:hypothetical protein
MYGVPKQSLVVTEEAHGDVDSNHSYMIEADTVTKLLLLPPWAQSLPQGQSLNLIQDLPISRPYAPSDIDTLVRSKEVATLCSFYIDLASAGGRIQAVLERMRALGGVITFTLVKVISCG